MAIIDKKQYTYIADRDELQSIGLKLPLTLDNGELGLTKTTIEAVKQNVLSLCSTESGERIMQPTLGIRLKRFIFEPFSEEVVNQIKIVIQESMNYWMPFVQITDIRVQMSDNTTGDSKSRMEASIDFNLSRDPNTTASVQILIGGE